VGPAVTDLDERFVEVVVSENYIGTKGVNVKDRLAPGGVAGGAAGPLNHTDARG
jgi:hypothetical protein